MTASRVRTLAVAGALLLNACGSDDAASTDPLPDGGHSDAVGDEVADALADAVVDAREDGTDTAVPGPAAYFIAVHNEPAHVPNGKAIVAANYELLREMVARADDANVKLTLMFSAQWADHIVADDVRHAEVQAWKTAGHEIAAHHHSIYHGNWDGYTDYTAAEAIAQRLALGYQAEPYLGTLDDYVARLSLLDPDIVSGCMNDEVDKRAMPSTILFDTCLGYANHGDTWVDESDALVPEKGINEYAAVGTWDGVERKWLAHYQITRPERTASAQVVFDEMPGGVYGAVLHSTEKQATELYAFLEFLQERDPGGERSRTVREVAESGLLPTRTVPDELLEKQSPPTPSPDGGLCGDGVCDALEQANPNLCPEDCP